jgi:hypothetical protein
LSIAFYSRAQENIDPVFILPRSVIKLSPLQLFNNTLGLGVETFNSSFSRSFQASMGFRSGGISYNNAKGASLEFAYRKYVLPMKYTIRKQRAFYQDLLQFICTRHIL